MTAEVISFKTCGFSKMASAQLISTEIVKLYYSTKSVTVLKELKGNSSALAYVTQRLIG